MGSWNLNSSSPWVATLGFLCQNKAAGCAEEEFFVWSQDATLAGGGCVGPGLAWRGLCSIPAWQNGEDLGAFRRGSVQGKKAEFYFKVTFSILYYFFFNTMGLPTTNRGIKSLISPPSLKLMIFYSPVNAFIECPAEVTAFRISKGARDQGLAPETASVPTLSFILSLAAPLLPLTRQSSVF